MKFTNAEVDKLTADLLQIQEAARKTIAERDRLTAVNTELLTFSRRAAATMALWIETGHTPTKYQLTSLEEDAEAAIAKAEGRAL